MFFRHDGIAQSVVLIIVLDNAAGQAGAFGDAQARADGAGRHVAHNHFQRDDLNLADQLLAHIEPADKVVGDANLGQTQHQILADAVVQYALAGDDTLFGAIARSCVVLEILNEGPWLRTLE